MTRPSIRGRRVSSLSHAWWCRPLTGPGDREQQQRPSAEPQTTFERLLEVRERVLIELARACCAELVLALRPDRANDAASG